MWSRLARTSALAAGCAAATFTQVSVLADQATARGWNIPCTSSFIQQLKQDGFTGSPTEVADVEVTGSFLALLHNTVLLTPEDLYRLRTG